MSRSLLPLAAPLAAVALLAGCSAVHGRHSGYRPVADTDYARLRPDQLGPVDQARVAEGAARDEVARAKLRLEQAQSEIAMARADQTAARAAGQRAAAQRDRALSSNAPAARAGAQEAAAEAELQARAAQAHMAYAQRLVEARRAEREAADRLVVVRQAELERARLSALAQAGVPAATKYDPAAFDARVADAQRDYQQRRADAAQRLDLAQQNENAWRVLHAQYQARVEGPGRTYGTGAGAQQQLPAPAQAPPAQ